MKTNIGHLDAAAGVAGLIKTVLALKHRQLPPSLHFEPPNPGDRLREQPVLRQRRRCADGSARAQPRRAGVSSFGIGGTNAHVVLEEAPAPAAAGRPATVAAAAAVGADRERRWTRQPAASQRTWASTRSSASPTSRTRCRSAARAFAHRRVVVAATLRRPRRALRAGDRARAQPASPRARRGRVVFMFPGQGAQYATWAASCTSRAGVPRQVDRLRRSSQPHSASTCASVLCPSARTGRRRRARGSTRPRSPSPRCSPSSTPWPAAGCPGASRPRAMLGHSIGEYVAACLAGRVLARGRAALVADARPADAGAAAAARCWRCRCRRRGLRAAAWRALSMAAVNAPAACMVSGPVAERSNPSGGARARRVAAPLHTSHAFHSAMMDPVSRISASVAAGGAAAAAVPSSRT